MTVKASDASAAAVYKETFNLSRFMRTYAAQIGILAVFAAMWLAFIILAPTTFLCS